MGDRVALLFDLDGTLIDSIGLLLASMQHAFDGRTRVPTVAQWTAGIGTPLRSQLAEWCDDDAAVEALVDRYRTYQDVHLERMTSLYPGVRELLEWARGDGYRLGIVTSKGRGMTARSLDHVGIAGMFDVVVTYEDTSTHKPGPEPVLHALARLGCDRADAVFIGDSPHDMFAGRSAGVRTAACLWGPFSRDELASATPTWWLDSPGELAALVTRVTSVTSPDGSAPGELRQDPLTD